MPNREPDLRYVDEYGWTISFWWEEEVQGLHMDDHVETMDCFSFNPETWEYTIFCESFLYWEEQSFLLKKELILSSYTSYLLEKEYLNARV